jgi:hypothetical protein
MQPPQNPPEQSPQQSPAQPPQDAPLGDDHEYGCNVADGYASLASAASPPENSQRPQAQALAKARLPMSRRTQYLLLAGVLMTAFVCGPAIWVLAAHPSSFSSQAVGPHATTIPYLTPTSYYTPVPTIPVSSGTLRAIIYTPTLGGTLGAFQQKYGPSTDGSGLTYTAVVAGQPVQMLIAPGDPSKSLDGRAHVVEVQVWVPSDRLTIEQWSATTVSAIVKAFLPTDARFQRTASVSRLGDVVVTEHIYISKGMASTFTPDQFIHASDGTQVPIGTVNYFCERQPPATSGYELCDISIGD